MARGILAYSIMEIRKDHSGKLHIYTQSHSDCHHLHLGGGQEATLDSRLGGKSYASVANCTTTINIINVINFID